LDANKHECFGLVCWLKYWNKFKKFPTTFIIRTEKSIRNSTNYLFKKNVINALKIIDFIPSAPAVTTVILEY